MIKTSNAVFDPEADLVRNQHLEAEKRFYLRMHIRVPSEGDISIFSKQSSKVSFLFFIHIFKYKVIPNVIRISKR